MIWRRRSLAVICAATLGSGVAQGQGRGGIECIVDPRPGQSAFNLVVWLQWNSPFVRAGLQIGDRIVRVEGEPIPRRSDGRPIAIGVDGDDSQFWRDAGKAAGDVVRLEIERDGERRMVEARLIADRVCSKGADGTYRYGADGPARQDERLGNLESFRRSFRQEVEPHLLPAEWCEFRRGVRAYPMSSRRASLEEVGEKLADLEARHPGAFTAHHRALFDRALASIEGEGRELTAESLEWRRLGEQRAREVAEAADRAEETLLALLAGDIHPEPFPAPDPSGDDFDAFVGRVVRTEPATARDFVFEAGKVLVGQWEGREVLSAKSFVRHARRGERGVYFTPRHTPKMWAASLALAEYGRQVLPLDQRRTSVQIIGRVLDEPLMVTGSGRSTEFGLALDPIAMMVRSQGPDDRRLFVDLREVGALGDAPPFAGQEELQRLELVPQDESDPPERVFARFVDALKLGDYESWKAMFADWEVSWARFNQDDGPIRRRYREAYLDESMLERAWRTSCEALLDAELVQRKRLAPSMIYDVEIVGRTPRTTVYEGAEEVRGIERIRVDPVTIEEVTLFVQFVGELDGEFRTFRATSTFGYRPFWRLQRRDGGPWKITEIDAL